MNAEFVNLTPHLIRVFKDNGEIIEIPPSGIVARVRTETVKVGEIDGIDVVATRFGEVENLPPPQEGVIYIVSTLVLSAITDRYDVVAPDTSPQSAIRDESGRIVGVRRFQVMNV